MDQRGFGILQAILGAVIITSVATITTVYIGRAQVMETKPAVSVAGDNAATEIQAALTFDTGGANAASMADGSSAAVNGVTVTPTNGSAVVQAGGTTATVPLVAQGSAPGNVVQGGVLPPQDVTELPAPVPTPLSVAPPAPQLPAPP